MRSPVLIVGGGLAGLFCALKLAPMPVTVLAAAPMGQGASSAWAQGGIAAALSEGDSPEKHAADTVIAGAGLVDPQIVIGMAREAGERVHDLLAFGVPFDRSLEGQLMLSREAAHSERRIVRVRGDMAGKAIMEALIAAVRRVPSITVLEGELAEALVCRDGRVIGVAARGDEGKAAETTTYLAGAVVLATGGVGHLYAVTTNPQQANGNGVAIAAEAGALVADAEFVQFHPTAIDIGRDPAPLATEALRGDGATLINGAGERFMLALHPDAELAPRDVVARGVFAEAMAGRGAFLDCRTAIGAEFAERFPTVHAVCSSAGIDPVTDPIPVVPAEHYHMGGLWTDDRGATSLPGLWAIGEVASTGVHGANRLASNSLLEAIVFADRAAADIRALEPASPSGDIPAAEVRTSGVPQENSDLDLQYVARLRRIMADHVGVVRDAEGLRTALAGLLAIEREAQTPAARNMARTALLIAASAYARRESRGGHMRSDYPQPDPSLAQRSRLTLGEARWIALGATEGAGVLQETSR